MEHYRTCTVMDLRCVAEICYDPEADAECGSNLIPRPTGWLRTNTNHAECDCTRLRELVWVNRLPVITISRSCPMRQRKEMRP